MRASENIYAKNNNTKFDRHEIHFAYILYQLHLTVIVENFDFDSQVNLLEMKTI